MIMGIAAIPKETISAGQAIIANHVVLYRFVVVSLVAAGCYVSEIFRVVIYCWLTLSIAGLILFVVDRDGFNSGFFLRFVFPFVALLYVWNGFR
ncbi:MULTISPECIES: hypothetical protein [unclassified Sinorhizobium]|uniref:hypothetical protein n=1 Tax=unclassified Sinorhizobium TaxID=2613772 RepID=UPI003523DF4C